MKINNKTNSIFRFFGFSYIFLSLVLFLSFSVVLAAPTSTPSPSASSPAPSPTPSGQSSNNNWASFNPGGSPTYDPLGKISITLDNVSRFKSWEDFIKSVPYILWGIIGIIFIVMVFVNGLRYMNAGGNEEQTTKAKSGMIYAVVGLVIAICASLIINWIQGLF